ncbi:MAG: chromate efflux transporter [Aphanocapsa feldmannii 277cV]|uniref:Chromate efflux transporter n=1 Tax=Aphanocapsa feldmannii 277cV TaxID=2507553 RepID=A0A524RR13_9CHRO|nr:MAG: chromate efflux transporter [Aphanocapsa feldmannii 277cV]
MVSIPLPALAGTYLRIGALGFGGPQAHLALLQNEIVERRGWVAADRFDEGLGLCEALPGPASSQMAIYLGCCSHGTAGGLLSGLCFLTPGLLLVLLLSALWRQGQGVMLLQLPLALLQPVVAAIVWRFAWTQLQRRDAPWQRATTLLVAAATLLNHAGVLPAPAGLLLLLAGLARAIRPDHGLSGLIPLPLLTMGCKPLLASLTGPGIGLAIPGLFAELFLLFFKAGLLIFGGGLVLIPLLRDAVVAQGWVDAAGFLDGVAIGQLTPGPVVLTSAFVGYQAGWQEGGPVLAISSALWATVAIFLPSFLLVLIAAPWLERWRRLIPVQAFLAGVLAGVPGLLLAAALPITLGSLQGSAAWDCLLRGAVLVAALAAGRRLQPAQLLLVALLTGLLPSLVMAWPELG